MNIIEKRSRYVATVMQDFKNPLSLLFNSMPKRWRIYATDLVCKFGDSWEGTIRVTYIYGCRKRIWIRIGDRSYRNISVKVSRRGHIYLE